MYIKTKLAARANYGNKRLPSTIKYIVVHYTANDGDSDEGNSNYFANNIVSASAHYFVDGDSVTQSVPDNYVAYSVGGSKYSDCNKSGGGKFYGLCTNTNSISIELCDEIKNGKSDFSAKTIKNAIELIKMLMNRYSVDLNHIVRHFDVTGKKCPLPFVDSQKWQEFKEKIIESEDLTMVQYDELKNLISNIAVNVENIKNSNEKVYNNINEIPDWGRATIENLLYKGYLKGDGNGNLNIPNSMLRILVILDRAELFN